ncbi:CU044_5270 family protein [Actinomadura sp. NPDC000600]|uniref:CU044_5270 family protein n=1 Tax=Actinomadura sp. NPDC000600 TaxID=3154262 RepID=UPI003391B4CF
MNELERMCAEVAPPDEKAVAEGRLRLLAVAHRADPAAARKRRRPQMGRGWRVVAPAGLAGALAVGVIAVQQTSDGGPAGPQQVKNVSTVEILHRAAAAARSEQDLRLRDDQYLYVKSTLAWGPGVLHPGKSMGRQTREVWESADGRKPGLLREPCSDDPARTCDIPLVSEDAPPSLRNPNYKRDLRSVPKELREWRASIAHPKDPSAPAGSEAWAGVTDLLGENYLPPELRAEVFDFVAEIPGTTVTEHVTDGLGRSGVAVSKTEDNVRKEIIFDPKTYRHLGMRQIYYGPKPHITDWRTIPEGAVVDKVWTVLETKAVNQLPKPVPSKS